MLQLIIISSNILLIATSIFGIHARIERKVTTWLEFSRLLYIILLVSTIVFLIRNHLIFLHLSLIWITLIIISYIVMETGFRLKRETFGNLHIEILLILLLIINLTIGTFMLTR